MSSVSGPGNRVNEALSPQPAAGSGTISPQQAQQIAEAPAVAPQQPRNTYEGQGRRPSGEKLGAAGGQHVPLPTMALGQTGAARPGPLDPKSDAGQQLIQKADAVLAGQVQSIVPTGAGFVPRSVERDALGMTHVRMDRTQNGVPVFGEQQIVHFGSDGQVRDITGEMTMLPPELGKSAPKLSEQQARQIAEQAYGKQSEVTPSVQRVIARGEDGQFRDAYLVGTQRVQDTTARPEKMQFLVDGNTGKVMQKWNLIGGDQFPEAVAALRAKQGAAGDPVSVDVSASPKAKVNDFQTVTSKLKIDKDMSLESLKLDLDIKHTYKGDLVVKVTSPSGKEYTVHNRTGGSTDNVKGSFDLTQAFKDEKNIAGEWTLSVSDKARRDTGTLNSWALHAKGKEKGENPPPPPPPPPPGGADDKSIYAGNVEIRTTKLADGTHQLLDSTRGKGIETRDAMNKSNASGAKTIVDNNDKWGEASDPARNAAAVDAQYGAQSTYDFLKGMFGRDSIDGKGEKLISNIHINNNYVNAYWDGSQMYYGDGDGRNASVLTSIDVAGHEIMHGLTERTAGLIYSGESGGLNEAMSDILGSFGVEWHAGRTNPALKGATDNYKVGEQVWTPGKAGDALRYMDDPTKDGYSIDNYSKYGSSDKEVHRTSGIANNAFALLVKGGTNRTSGQTVNGGIGEEKSLQIFYRALTTYMTPNTTFAQARQACLKAATDLYGASSAEVSKVAEAWSAVGVK